jgi:hypothetical protein
MLLYFYILYFFLQNYILIQKNQQVENLFLKDVLYNYNHLIFFANQYDLYKKYQINPMIHVHINLHYYIY